MQQESLYFSLMCMYACMCVSFSAKKGGMLRLWKREGEGRGRDR